MGPLRKRSDEDANQAEIDRLASLPIEMLAAEVLPHLSRIELRFGSIGPTASEVAEAMAPSKLKGQAAIAMYPLIAEGLQALEHAGVVRLAMRGGDTSAFEYGLTRAGQAAIASGDVAQRLLGPQI